MPLSAFVCLFLRKKIKEKFICMFLFVYRSELENIVDSSMESYIQQTTFISIIALLVNDKMSVYTFDKRRKKYFSS